MREPRPGRRPHLGGAPSTGPRPVPTPRTAALGALAVLVAALLFSVNGTVSKIALQSGLSTMRLVELRSLGSAVILMAAVLVVAPGRLRVRGKELAAIGILGVVGMALVQWLYFVAISRLPVGVALLLEFTAPLLVALWARFVLRESVRARVWWALAACLSGLALVARVGQGITLDAVGVAAGLGAAVCLATYFLLGDRLVRARDPLSTQAVSMVFAAAFWIVLQPLWTFDTRVLTAEVALPGILAGQTPPLWALVTWIVVLGTVVPYVLVLAGLARIGPARAGVIGMVEPVGAGAVAWVVLGESMTATQLAGGAVVLAGVLLAETARTRPVSPPAPVSDAVLP
ncbi:DMT family transporter [Actinotalea sp. K2]|uniref:EamA family transporter n=1 Tax=Actinotalea sp. K2 TaxID=2939438 RepID=UPI002016CEA7|nr:EamA family transporter [Actinotalea sp. K2]MCL3861654.1 EamA family transporter [Actinotalea sp. K2]